MKSTMLPVGHPKFVYHIPYEKDDNWYLILTSSNSHFYFNRSLKKSYWQLYDIFSENKGIKEKDFVDSIDYDWVSVLVAKNNGLKDIYKRYIKVQASEVISTSNDNENSSEEHHEVKKKDFKAENNDSDNYESPESSAESDVFDNEDTEKGAEHHGVIEENSEPPGNPEPGAIGLGILDGYSSSDSEDEADDNQSTRLDDESKHSPSNSDRDADIDNSENDVNQGLNLSLSGDELEGLDLSIPEGDDSSKTDEFMSVLDGFGDRISIYDTWSLVRDELIEEFVQHPGFFAITDDTERSSLFNQWCKKQREGSEGLHEVDARYPTSAIKLFRFLSEHKKEVKSSFYQEFSNKHVGEMASLDLTPKNREHLYRLFKITITEFAEYEKREKKGQHKNSEVNLKKKHLEDFLVSKSSQIDISLHDKSEVDQFVSHLSSLKMNIFDQWVKLLNDFDVPEDIANSPSNFIVGDDKRFNTYLQFLRDLYNGSSS